MFYQSYVKNQQVNFPHHEVGYAFHPYRFRFETMWDHYNISDKAGTGSPIQKGVAAALIYRAELSTSLLNNTVRIHFHNNARYWGHSPENLILSQTARRFPGIDFIVEPTPWLRYSFLTGSLFSYPSQKSGYRRDVYGYDLGHVQKMFTLHTIEFTPMPWMQFAFSGGNIWSKRLEPAYLMPFVLPHLAQIDVGDHDNLSLNFDWAFLIPRLGKTWFSLFVDEFSFTREGKLLKMPRNRYAWQWGLKSGLLNSLIPSTLTEIPTPA